MSLVLLLGPCLGEKFRGSMKTILFIYVEVMWWESSRSELVQELHVKSLGSLVLSSLDRMLLPNAIVLAN